GPVRATTTLVTDWGAAAPCVSQYTTVKVAAGSRRGEDKPQTASPAAVPCAPSGFPLASNSCQATEPPWAHPVPSVQASRTSPRRLAAIDGCLRNICSVDGRATGKSSASFPPSGEKYTWPAFSHAANDLPAPSVRDTELMGQAFSSQELTVRA